MKKLWLLTVILILAFFVTACSGDTTEETPKNNNNEVSEKNNADATTGSDLGTLGTVEAISLQWEVSGHADTGSPLNYAGGRDGCQPCHSGNGFTQLLTDKPFTPEADAEAAEAAGEETEGAHVQAQMGCATCHTGVGKDMIDTGIAPDGYVPFADGNYEAGTGTALCIACHNGRRDTVAMYESWVDGEEKEASYPHYDAGALFSGEGGMQYPDVTYANSDMHQQGGCTTCHMAETEDGFASHDFGMEIEYIEQTCGSCHKDATDFTVGGTLQAELDALLEELQAAAVATVDGAARVGTGRTTFPFEDEAGEAIDLENVSTEAFVAAYNYFLISTDKSGGAHNPQYAKSLLEESLKALQ